MRKINLLYRDGRLAELSLADTTVLKSGVIILTYELVSSKDESA